MNAAPRTINPHLMEVASYPLYLERLPDAEITRGRYTVRFARTPEELDAVLKLRFEVFNLELNEGLESSFLTSRDHDEFDLTCHHLMVIDRSRGEVVGTYRLRTGEMANTSGGFYSSIEFDLSCLQPDILLEAVEIGRACIAGAHRNTQVLFLLWQGMATYMTHNRQRYFFGCCSIPSQDPQEGMRVLNYLQQQGYLHPTLFVIPQQGFECVPHGYFIVDGQESVIPRLFHTYLRFGAKVCGLPAIDRLFKTIDYFVILDAQEISAHTRQLFFDV